MVSSKARGPGTCFKHHLRLASGRRTALYTVLRRLWFLVIYLWATSQKTSPHWRYCLSPRGISSPPVLHSQRRKSFLLHFPFLNLRVPGLLVRAPPTSKVSAGLSNLVSWCHEQKYYLPKAPLFSYFYLSISYFWDTAGFLPSLLLKHGGGGVNIYF